MTDTPRSHNIDALWRETVVRLRHYRMGHTKMSWIEKTTQTRTYAMAFTGVDKIRDCLSCTDAKHTRNIYNGTLIIKNVITIHADIFSPMRTISCLENKYFHEMTTRDQNYVRVYFLKSKASVVGHFENYVSWLERHAEKKSGCTDTDNAPEIIHMRKEFNKRD